MLQFIHYRKKNKKESKISCCVYKTSFKRNTVYLVCVCMKSNLNGAITCIATLLHDLMSSVPTGTENTITETPKVGTGTEYTWYGTVRYRSVLV
ncbi:hypothetical protein Hanom_Chr13g01196321 [Helianthus anomalus]